MKLYVFSPYVSLEIEEYELDVSKSVSSWVKTLQGLPTILGRFALPIAIIWNAHKSHITRRQADAE